MNMDLLKQQQNRGYVIAGGAAIIAFIAFFLPYVTASYLGISASANGTSGGWLWLEEIAALVAIGVSAVLLFRNNAFGLTNMPVEKQVRFGRITLLAAGILALVIHLLFLLGYQNEVGGGLGTSTPGFSFGLGFGWFLFLIAAVAMVVGAVMATRQPVAAYAASQAQYGQYGQPYPGQPTQYPPYQQPYSTPDQPQYPPYQTPQQYPPPPQQQNPGQQQYPAQPQQPYQQPQYPPSQPQQYPPTELQQPPQYPPQR
jgi:hypothetical protein